MSETISNYLRFRGAMRALGVCIYVLLTRSPLSDRSRSVRLACLIHAASIHPEPGSNSQIYPVKCSDGAISPEAKLFNRVNSQNNYKIYHQFSKNFPYYKLISFKSPCQYFTFKIKTSRAMRSF